MQNSLLTAYAAGQAAQAPAAAQGDRSQPLHDQAATLALHGELGKRLAEALLSPTAVIGPDGHTFQAECELFANFTPPGFRDSNTEAEQARALLANAFGLNDAAELPAALATAAWRSGSPKHALAHAAIAANVVPGDAPVGLDSTLAQELMHFSSGRAGF